MKCCGADVREERLILYLESLVSSESTLLFVMIFFSLVGFVFCVSIQMWVRGVGGYLLFCNLILLRSCLEEETSVPVVSDDHLGFFCVDEFVWDMVTRLQDFCVFV